MSPDVSYFNNGTRAPAESRSAVCRASLPQSHAHSTANGIRLKTAARVPDSNLAPSPSPLSSANPLLSRRVSRPLSRPLLSARSAGRRRSAPAVRTTRGSSVGLTRRWPLYTRHTGEDANQHPMPRARH